MQRGGCPAHSGWPPPEPRITPAARDHAPLGAPSVPCTGPTGKGGILGAPPIAPPPPPLPHRMHEVASTRRMHRAPESGVRPDQELQIVEARRALSGQR